MHETREPGSDQAQPEAERDAEVLAVGLADRVRVVDEAARQSEAHHQKISADQRRSLLNWCPPNTIYWDFKPVIRNYIARDPLVE
jgi:hypothetical protein